METKIEPRWWKRDPDSGEIIMFDEIIDRFYPITIVAFTRDWSAEGKWGLPSRRYMPFGRLSISMALLKKHEWRME